MSPRRFVVHEHSLGGGDVHASGRAFQQGNPGGKELLDDPRHRPQVARDDRAGESGRLAGQGEKGRS
jgi:hypothetical protein